jgi:hypothetical protein
VVIISEPTKITYIVLGVRIELKNYYYVNDQTASMVATLNVLGKPYYDELKKQGTSFPQEIEEFLEIEFKILERNNKIDSVINKA